MSEYDHLDRTEEATPRRLEQAREKGNVARSADLSTAVVLLGGLLVLKFWGHIPMEALCRFTRGALGNMGARAMETSDLYAFVGGAGVFLLKAMMPVIGGLLAIAFLANVVQVGFLFSSEPVTFKFERINAAEGLKRLVSRRGLVRLLTGVFKVAVVGLVAGVAIYHRIGACAGLSDASIDEIFAFILGATFDVALKTGVALLALAVLDFAYQRWQHRQDLRMTRQEVRDELKRMEGDPLMRDRRRRLQRRVAAQRMMHRIPGANVVVAAGQELAVALVYDDATMDAPTVVARGRGPLARRILDIASDADVPVVERDTLAETLATSCDVGDSVPAALYDAVAETLAFVREIHRMRPARAAAGAA